MNPLNSLVFWIKGNLVRVLIIAFMLLVSLTAYLWNRVDYLKYDRNRIEENFGQLTKTNSVLNITLAEYQQIQTRDKAKLDSLLAIVKIKPRTVKGATIINTVYRDTGSTKVIYKTIVKLPDSSYKIPFSVSENCWGIKGNILSLDSKSKLEIIEKTAENSAQLVVTKKKKFLFWTIRPEKYQAFSDCGEITFTQINFVKK